MEYSNKKNPTTEGILEMENLSKKTGIQSQASPTEFKRRKREVQVQMTQGKKLM